MKAVSAKRSDAASIREVRGPLATNLDARDEADIRAMFCHHDHRDYQLKLLGVPKAAMVDFLWDGLSRFTGRTFVCRREDEDGPLSGLVALAPALWLTDRLGCRVWTVRHLLTAPDAPPGTVAALVAAGTDALENAADFVYGRVASSDIAAIEGLQAAGFQTVGGEVCGVFPDLTAIEAPRPAPESEAGEAPRFVPLADERVEEVAAIARRAHDINHFAYDRRLLPERVAALYEALVRFDAARTDAGVVVAEQDDELQGFLSYTWNRALEAYAGRRLGSLNYIGVAPETRLRGLGDQLNRHAIAALRREGVVAATVRTMMSNYRALSILRKLGVRIASSNLVFHRWLPSRRAASRPFRSVD